MLAGTRGGAGDENVDGLTVENVAVAEGKAGVYGTLVTRGEAMLAGMGVGGGMEEIWETGGGTVLAPVDTLRLLILSARLLAGSG